jgi:hypothetical protein
MKTAAAMLMGGWAGPLRAAVRSESGPPTQSSQRKVIIVTCGGLRRAETFLETGLKNIPHLYRDLLPQSTFYPFVRNDGVTSHYNTISSILTGNWQRVDDWGKTPSVSPTAFEYLRKRLAMPPEDTWFISSNKALSSQIGASSARGYGPQYGANVMFPKQLLINAVVNAASQGRAAHTADRASMQQEIRNILETDNYEGLGWSVSEETSALARIIREARFSESLLCYKHVDETVFTAQREAFA